MLCAVHRIRRIEPELAIYISGTHLRVRHRSRNHIDLNSKIRQQLTSAPRSHKITGAKYQRSGRIHQLLVFEDCLNAVASTYTVSKLDHYAVRFDLSQFRNNPLGYWREIRDPHG